MAQLGEVKIDVSPRIHLGLISMHADAARKNGGVGFSIAEPKARITLAPADGLTIIDNRDHPLTVEERRQLSEAVRYMIARDGLRSGAAVQISGDLRTHFGLGSGTALRLGIMEGLHVLNGSHALAGHIVDVSGRGGTSGIGINTYFSGGFILDLGVPNDGRGFVPSSSSTGSRSPDALPSVLMPNWPLCLCLPRKILPKTQEEERAFFSRTAPLAAAESYEAAYHGVFGIYAAVADEDYRAFCASIEAMQQTRWKLSEWLQYGDALQTLKRTLTTLGADCVGMSSLGPMLFCFGPSSTLAKIQLAGDALDCDVICTVPSNCARIVSE